MATLNMHARACAVDGCDKPWYKRGWCSKHYRAWRTHGDPLFSMNVSNGGRCSVIGCSKPPRSRTSPHCEMHYGRLRQHGSIDLPARPALTHSDGYILAYQPDHPLRRPSSPRVYEHRAVFFAAHGDGPFQCHMCNKTVTWDTMHVDHLNDVKDDNRIENLRPACPPCNEWRDKDRVVEARKSPHVRWIEFNGDRLPLSAWAKRIGISSAALGFRLESGWPLDRALTAPRGVTGPRSRREQGFARRRGAAQQASTP